MSDDKLKQFDPTIIQAIKTAHIYGAAMLTIADGQIEFTEVYGLADPQTGITVTPDTMFTIASISKPVTATVLMTLYEQGKFSLDDNINLYLPFEVCNANNLETPITFRMLLSHTSSIQDSDVLEKHYTLHKTPVIPDSPIPLGDYLKDYLSADGKLYNAHDNFLKEAPGTRYKYSNTGFGLIGYLVECITGIPFYQYCKQAVFKPLGIKNAAWHFEDIDTSLMAVPYGYDTSLHQPIRYGFYSYPTYPDGALKISVNEFARFLSIFINDGRAFEGETFLLPETVKLMLNCRSFPGIDPGQAVGLAWHFDGEVYHHNGGDPGISTETYFNPDTRQGMIFFCNGSDFDLEVYRHSHSKNHLSLIHSPAKTNIISEVIQKADEKTLVIWDVDGVLFIGKDRIFHSENIYSGLNQQYVEYIENKFNLTPMQTEKFLSQLLLQRPIKLVDKALLGIIHELKTRGIKTIALTQFATGPLGDIKSVADWRIDELNTLGIKFDFAFTDLIQVELDKLTKLKGYHPLYKQGILFCERHSKGDVLGAFLDLIPWKPNKVIFIDDKMEYLEMVQVELKSRNIDYIGVHYTVALDFPYEIDDGLVKFQYEYAMQNGIWLNDQAALEKLRND